MLILELRFPGGRFHATPWDAHVNEGRVEWPPSPYRLLRALVSVAWTRVPDVDRRVLDSLLGRLAADSPLYALPPASTGHVRSFVPHGTDRDKGEYKREKLFDAFVHADPASPLRVVHARTELPPEEQQLLETLVSRLTYIGRAESWVDASLAPAESWDGACDAWPVRAGEETHEGDRLRFLVPLSSDELASFRNEGIASARADAESEAIAAGKVDAHGAPKLTKKQLEAIARDYPESVLDALAVDTGIYRSGGWARPPGTRWQPYVRAFGALECRPERRSRVNVRRRAPTLVRFAIDSAVRPRFIDSLSVTERVHEALAAHGAAELVGANATNDGTHHHGYLLCEPDARGRIAHVAIYAPTGFDETSREAVSRLRRVWGHGGHDLELVRFHETGLEDPTLDAEAPSGCPYVGRSRIWESLTPFVSTRHAKATRAGVAKLDGSGYQVGSPTHDLLRLLRLHGFPEPRTVEAMPHRLLGGKPTPWIAFRTTRTKGGGARGSGSPMGFRLVFDEPVSGPIVLGYGAHFGLGAFCPVGAEAAEAAP